MLTRRDAEPAGVNCPRGGTAIRAGRDGNANDVLDDAEVERTEYLCNASTTVLVRKDPVPPSTTCPDGGLAVKTGIDDDGDGVLDDAEVDQTTELCSSLELWDRDFTADDWRDPIKVAALRGARLVAGSLMIIATDSVELPLLESVGGDLGIGVRNAALSLPALRRVGGNTGIGAGEAAPALPMLSEVGGDLFASSSEVPLALPALGQVGGDLTVTAGEAEVMFDVLGKVHGELFVSGNASQLIAPRLALIEGRMLIWFEARGALALPGLVTLAGQLQLRAPLTGMALDRLESIGGGIRFDSANVTHGLVLPALKTLHGDVKASSENGLTSVEMPQLTELDGTLTLDGDALTRISLPAMRLARGDILIVGGLPALTTLDLHALQSVSGSLGVAGAPALTTLDLSSLVSVGTSDPMSHEALAVNLTGIEDLDFASLRTVTGDISLGGSALRTVRLPELLTTSNLSVDTPMLDTVTAPKLTAITALGISGPARTLDFGQLASVSNFLALNSVDVADLSGLHRLTRVNSLVLLHCDQLRNLRDLSGLQHVAFLDLEANRSLVSLDGLERLTDFTILRLENNQALTSVAGLRNVRHIDNLMLLNDNTALTTIELTGLRAVGGDFDLGGLIIDNMTMLKTLSGLDALSSVVGTVEMQGNDRLSPEEIRAFIERVRR